jgi:integrase
VYVAAWKQFSEFSGMTAEALIQEKWKDTQRPPIDRTDKAELRIVDFRDWLKKRFGEGRTTSVYIGAIQSLYKSSDVPLNLKKLGQRGFTLSSARKENRSMKMTAEQVERLTHYVPSLRDKALVWMLFQSGLDINTVLKLDWGDVAEEFEEPPLTRVEFENGETRDVPSVKIEVVRKKAAIEHRTFICKTAIEMLKKHLTERFGADFAKKMDWEEPLFTGIIGGNAGKRHDRRSVERLLHKVAPLTDLVKRERLEQATRNPLRPASLRASFSDALMGVRCPLDYIDFWMGHVSRYGGAYSSAERTDYCKFAWLALEPKGASPELEKRLRETDERFRELTIGLMEKDRRIAVLEKSMDWMLLEIRTFQRETLKRMGDSPTKIEQVMTVLGSKKEDYLEVK